MTVDTARGPDGQLRATLTSVPPRVRDAAPELVAGALAALGWHGDELDEALPPAVAYAGASHLILAAGTYERLRRLDDDFEQLRSIMLAADLTTVQLIWREASDRFRARDPFPVGNVVEDPATGAAAAALGAYLLLEDYYVSLGCTLGAAVLIIAFFNYYISVAQGAKFRRRFLEMIGLSFGVAGLSFGIGFVLRAMLGVDV